jgi:hypothetical protein
MSRPQMLPDVPPHPNRVWLEQTLVREINRLRVAQRLRPLLPHPLLRQAAQHTLACCRRDNRWSETPSDTISSTLNNLTDLDWGHAWLLVGQHTPAWAALQTSLRENEAVVLDAQKRHIGIATAWDSFHWQWAMYLSDVPPTVRVWW